MAGDRYFARGISQWFFLPSVSNPAAPTSSEITAGTEITDDMAEISGWDFQSNPIKTPNLKDAFTPQIPGEDTVGNSEVTFYDRNPSSDIRTLLPKGTTGYILMMPYGDTATRRAETWHVEVQSVSGIFSVGNDPARFKVTFGVLDPPEQEAVLP